MTGTRCPCCGKSTVTTLGPALSIYNREEKVYCKCWNCGKIFPAELVKDRPKYPCGVKYLVA